MAEQRSDAAIQQGGKMMKRRGVIAGAAMLVTAVLVKQVAQPVSAFTGNHDGQALIIGANTATGTANSSATTTQMSINAGGGDGFSILNSNGAGIYGQSDNFYGVYALSKAVSGTGMYGQAIGSSGTGVFGTSSGFTGIGVFGKATGGTGVGVQGDSGTYYGVQGTSSSSIAVLGVSQSGVGVQGQSHGIGVYGLSDTSYGIVGITTAGSPYSGITGGANTPGAAAFAGGTSTPGCYAAYFTGPVVVDGSFTVVNPANKHGAIQHPDGSYRLLYSMESPESWLEDFGKGTLTAGKASITLDGDFAAIAQTEDYYVFLTPSDPACKGLAVAGQTTSGFAVQETNGGVSGSGFYWRVVARPRTDAKVQRLAKFTLPNIKIPTVKDLPKVPEPSTPPSVPTGGTVGGQQVQAPPTRPAPTATATPASGTQGAVQSPVQPIPQPRSG